MDIAIKKHQGGVFPKEHFHPLPKCFFSGGSLFLSQIVRICDQLVWSLPLRWMKRGMSFLSLRAGDTPPSWLSR